MANMTSCLELVNRIDEQDQNTLLGRLDELQAAGWEPDIAQAKAARYALAAIEAEARASAPVDQTQTDAFRKWFGDSKVVDADGRPLVVYHGSTRGGISHNTVQKSFFTSSMDVATTYSKDDYSGSIGESPTVQEMYLRIENPLEIDASGEPWMRIEFEGRRHTTDDLAALARRRGHDGLIVRNVEDNVSDEELPPSDIYVTLGGRSQIKSANNNDGQFDQTNTDIRRSAERQTESPEFKRWFGASKVVDEDGKPRVMYHGTAQDITAFRAKQAGAIFVTDDVEFAGEFAARSEFWMLQNADAEGGPQSSQNIMPVYIKAENPFDFNNAEHIAALEQYESKNRYTERDISNHIGSVKIGSWEAIEERKVQAAIKSIGHDGFYVIEDGRKNLAVYSPTQIKSALGNSGSFDPSNPDIRRSAERQTDTPEFRNWSKGLPVYEDAVGVTGRGIYKVYHATRGDHSVLKPGGSDPTLSGKAIWLSPHAGHQAAMHNIMSRDGFRDGVNVMPLYARIERPLVIDDLVMLEWAREVFANGSREFPQLMTDQARAEVLKEYDSIILDGPSIGWKGETGEVIVFDSTQVKSAIGNNGDFDSTNPDIRFSRTRDQTQTPEFKRWFGGSNVVDADGKPLVVYHGTGDSFDAFDPARVGGNYQWSKGFYFAASPDAASEYAMDHTGASPARTGIPGIFAGQAADVGRGGANVMPVYLSMQNPLVRTARGNMSPDQSADRNIEKWMAEARANGNDGLIVRPGAAFGERGAIYIAFRPEQVKSAIGNDGSFDPANPDVRRSAERNPEGTKEFKAWSEGLPVIQPGQHEGGPGVFVAFHGTTHSDITQFRRIGNAEGFLGRGPYFTTEADDASENYAGVGPDLTSRIEQEKESLANDLDTYAQADMLRDYFDAEPAKLQAYIEDSEPEFTTDTWEDDDANIDTLWDAFGDKALDLAATRALKGDSDGLMMKVYVKLTKPADTTGSQELEYNVETDDDGDPVDETGALVDWVLKAREIGERYGITREAEEHIDDVMSEAADGSVRMKDVFDSALKRFSEAYDEDGNMLSPGQVFTEIAEELGYDGVIMDAGLHFGPGRRGFGGINIPGMRGVRGDTLHIVPFTPNQVKSYTGNSGVFSLIDNDIRRSQSRMDAVGDINLVNNYKVADLFRSSKKLNLWNKTVGTPYHLAQKYPEFKRVYDAIQRFIGDVSKFGTRAADMAPTILPKLETLKDVFRRPMPQEDVKALAGPIFEGTLNYTRDKDGNPVKTDDVGLAGVVWRPDELRAMWGLNDRQIGLYREFRNATNKSISDLSITDMLRYAGKDADPVREAALNAGTIARAQEIITAQLAQIAAMEPKRAAAMGEAIATIKEKGDAARGLIAKGYAPLSRYGDYTVYVVNGDEQIYFGMFETQREANRMARMMEEQHPDAEVRTGTMSKEGYKMFSGVTPETLALFGEAMGIEDSATDEQRAAFDKYLKLSKSNRSTMKRLIKRKGIEGYSEDFGRVLAGFVYSNARQSSVNLNAGEIGKTVLNIKESGPQNGDLLDYSVKLMQYVQNGQEEAQMLRGMLFTQYIGGSMASAITNLTQSFTTTWPTLSMHFGISTSARAMGSALDAVRNGGAGDADLQAAMKRAEEDGITAPQEVHQLMAQSQGRGSLQTGDGTKAGDALASTNNALKKVGLVWGKAFGWAEQMNRKVAFVAAYKLARERGMADPYAFAEKIVAETQYVMNKGNNPQWARGPVGATLFTFRKFMVNYLEGLARMWGNGPEGKKAFALSLAILWLMAGLGGFPGADDLDDLIDGFAQRVLNKNFSSTQAKREFFTEILGEAGAEFVMNGITGLPGAPIDVSGRLGLGNILPGTGIFTKKTSYAQDIKEVAGAAGDFVSRVATGAGMVAGGNVTGAAESFMPIAAANAYKAMQMAQLGYYKDMRNRKVVDTDLTDAALKGIGFQPSGVFRVQEATRTQQQFISLNKIRETEIADLWTRGRVERNPDAVNEAKLQIKQWNRDNPDSPISISESQINRRVKEAMMDKAKRIAKTAPKEIRADVKAQLQERIGE